MAKIYFTLTATKYYYGNEFLKSGMKLRFKKEPDNKFDKKAIVVKREDLGDTPIVMDGKCTPLTLL